MKVSNFERVVILIFAACSLAFCAQPIHAQETQSTASQTFPPALQAASPDSRKTYEVTVEGTSQWVDTNIDLRAGEKSQFTATGTVTYPANPSSKSNSTTPQTFGADGLARSWQDLIHQYAVTDGGHGALIGRLGSTDAAQPFLVGANLVYTAPVAGRLFLGINKASRMPGRRAAASR